MSLLTVNLDSLHKQATGPAPAGRYDAMVYDLQEVVSKAGNPYTRIVFELIDGQYTDGAATGRDGFVGRRIVCNKPWMMPRLLLAAGVITPDATGDVQVDRESLIEYPVVIDLSVKVFNDKPQNEVEAIFAVDGVPTPAGPDADIPF